MAWHGGGGTEAIGTVSKIPLPQVKDIITISTLALSHGTPVNANSGILNAYYFNCIIHVLWRTSILD